MPGWNAITDLVAQQKLVSDLSTREAASRKGLFVDPFLDDLQRDQGIAQTAAIVDGVLTLPISGSAQRPSNDISSDAVCAYTLTPVLSQVSRTGTMKVNPYMAFAMPPALVALNPAVDRWTDIVTQWTSPITQAFRIGAGRRSVTSATSATQLVKTTNTLISNLRQIDVQFKLTGFGPNEPLASVTFDGIPVTPSAI